MTQMIYDEFSPWPYHKPYGMVARPKQKPKRKKRASRSAKRSWIAVDLATPKYHQRIVPNKKRQNKRGKVTLGGDE